MIWAWSQGRGGEQRRWLALLLFRDGLEPPPWETTLKQLPPAFAQPPRRALIFLQRANVAAGLHPSPPPPPPGSSPPHAGKDSTRSSSVEGQEFAPLMCNKKGNSPTFDKKSHEQEPQARHPPPWPPRRIRQRVRFFFGRVLLPMCKGAPGCCKAAFWCRMSLASPLRSPAEQATPAPAHSPWCNSA